MMSTAVQSGNQPREGSRRSTLTVLSGVAGALLMAVAVGMVFALSPQASGPQGAQTIAEFYAEGGGHRGLIAAEPLAIIAGFLLLWFLGHLAARLGGDEGGSSRYRHSMLAGGVMFIVLAFSSIMVQTTVAGSVSFYEGFEVDPNIALAFSHLGYVLLVGAMVGAAVLLAAAGAQIRRGPTVISRWLGTTAYVLAVLSMLSMFFVYLPAALFLVWTVLAGISLLRSQPGAV